MDHRDDASFYQTSGVKIRKKLEPGRCGVLTPRGMNTRPTMLPLSLRGVEMICTYLLEGNRESQDFCPSEGLVNQKLGVTWKRGVAPGG